MSKKLTGWRREEEWRLACEQYHPCDIGLHVCGHLPDESGPLTILNLPTKTAGEARALFEAARAECACQEGEPDDFFVDLNIDTQVDEFSMSRQMLDRLKQIALASPAPKGET
jgi:hypothetical protein